MGGVEAGRSIDGLRGHARFPPSSQLAVLTSIIYFVYTYFLSFRPQGQLFRMKGVATVAANH